MSFFSNIFGGGNSCQEYLEKGAVVIDVRSPGEFQMGHVEGSTNIPLDQIPHKVNKIKAMKKPVILCCASGGRSGRATMTLQNEGVDCMNGGGWSNVARQVQSA